MRIQCPSCKAANGEIQYNQIVSRTVTMHLDDGVGDGIGNIDTEVFKSGTPTEVQCNECGYEGTAEEFGFKAEADKSEERTIIRTRLDIGISFRIGTVSEVDNLCEELEGDIEEIGPLWCESTGSGGGYQDMQFDGEDDVELALKAKQFAIDWLTKRIGEPGGGALDSGLWYVNLTEFASIQI